MGIVDDEILRGYLDGLDPSEMDPGGNASMAYRHGFENGRDDHNHKPRRSAGEARQIVSDIYASEPHP